MSYNESNGVSVGGSLHLWYPVVISHHIDRSSPLFRFLYDRWLYQQEAASREEEGALNEDEDDDDNDDEIQKMNHYRFLPKNTASRYFAPFQVVAVYEAVEQGTGAAILAKKTFTPYDIIQSYRFSSKLVQLDDTRGTVELDYHYFNTMVPLSRDMAFGPNARRKNHRQRPRRPTVRQGRRGRQNGKFHSGSGSRSGERRTGGEDAGFRKRHQ